MSHPLCFFSSLSKCRPPLRLSALCPPACLSFLAPTPLCCASLSSHHCGRSRDDVASATDIPHHYNPQPHHNNHQVHTSAGPMDTRGEDSLDFHAMNLDREHLTMETNDTSPWKPTIMVFESSKCCTPSCSPGTTSSTTRKWRTSSCD